MLLFCRWPPQTFDYNIAGHNWQQVSVGGFITYIILLLENFIIMMYLFEQFERNKYENKQVKDNLVWVMSALYSHGTVSTHLHHIKFYSNTNLYFPKISWSWMANVECGGETWQGIV